MRANQQGKSRDRCSKVHVAGGFKVQNKLYGNSIHSCRGQKEVRGQSIQSKVRRGTKETRGMFGAVESHGT